MLFLLGPIAENSSYQVFLGKKQVSKGNFKSWSDIVTLDLPIDQIKKDNELSIKTDSTDKSIYWSVNQNLWRTTPDLPAIDSSEFQLKKAYVSSAGSVGTPLTGEIVTVYLNLENPSKVELGPVVVTDYLPSGFVALNRKFKNTPRLRAQRSLLSASVVNTVYHQDRVEFAFDKLMPGSNLIAYQARVINSTSSSVLPTQAEFMYQPQITLQTAISRNIELIPKPTWTADYSLPNELSSKGHSIILPENSGLDTYLGSTSKKIFIFFTVFILITISIVGTLFAIKFNKNKKLLSEKIVGDLPAEPSLEIKETIVEKDHEPEKNSDPQP